MAIKPIDDKVDKVFDYIFENYMMSDSRFPPEMWAECSSSLALNRSTADSTTNSILLILIFLSLLKY